MTTLNAYRFAAFLAARFGADTILHVGERDSRGVLSSAQAATAADSGPDVVERRRFLSDDRWIMLRPSARVDDPGDDVLRRSVLVCAGVLDAVRDPTPLMQRLATMSPSALATIITAAEDRWTLPAFTRALEQHGLSVTFAGRMPGDSEAEGRHLLAVSDRCPLEAGRAAPADFRPLALMPTFNDLDIVEQVVMKLLDDGMDVYIRDNWSTDGTFERLRALAGTRRGLSVGRFPDDRPSAHHEYLGLLGWKEEVAAAHPGRWIVSVDSDEVRASPWADVSFRGGLYICERMGFTAVDLTVLNFRPVNDDFVAGLDPERAFRYFEFGRRSPHFHQIKTWRQGRERIDLVGSGGHEARFPGRRIFPYKFMLKHYPLRSTDQARRKVFGERKPRYSPVTRAWGWHTQYDDLNESDTFVRDPSTLVAFTGEDEMRREHLLELISGIGLVSAVRPPTVDVNG